MLGVGKDGTRVWDLQSMIQIPDRPTGAGVRGATTAMTWTNRADEPCETLFFGTVTGYLISWRQVEVNICIIISRVQC